MRTIRLPAFLYIEVKRHLDWFAEKDLNGLLFVGEKGALRGSSFGRKWRRARGGYRREGACRTRQAGSPATARAESLTDRGGDDQTSSLPLDAWHSDHWPFQTRGQLLSAAEGREYRQRLPRVPPVHHSDGEHADPGDRGAFSGAREAEER